jgi:outer membrane receptor for ferrienterochelin and colicin
MLRKTVLAHALSIAFTATVTSMVVLPAAYAQSNTTGAISGKAPAGATVVLENKAIGVTRTIKVSSDGSYSVPQLPPGTYQVKATTPNGTVEEATVFVSAGVGASADFGAIQTVSVTGTRSSRIDVKSPESSMVLTKAAIDRIPVTRDVTAVALLAPGATKGDARIGQTALRGGNVPSLGGASPAENVYYINGFNVTNSLNGVAFNQVPFDAIGQQQVKTGGYSAEYGRSLGGVLSVTTKRGTNEWKGGVNVIYSPESTSASAVYAEKSPSTGKWNLVEKPGGTDDLQSNIWLGGPVIKDKLFIFGLVQGADIERKTYNSNRQDTTTSNSPKYLLKADWNINDSNLLELTAFSDKTKDKVKTWVSPTAYGKEKGEFQGNDEYTTGGENYIGKYTSWVTNDLTVSALVGLGRYNRKSDVSSSACPYITDRRTSTIKQYGCATQTSITDPKANDERKAYRIDAEWTFGDHGLRFGMDNETYKVTDGTFYPGGDNYRVTNLNAGGKLSNGYVNNTGAVQQVVTVRHFENGGSFETKNSAFYLEDNWQVTKNVVASIGVRNESFKNMNAEGATFIDVKNTWAPRLGLVWDVKGNSDTKVFANAGRYYIPVMSNTNVRLAGAELDYSDYYAFGGSFAGDKTALPAMGQKLGNRLVVSDGKAGDPKSVVDPKIKPMFQDEYILGIQQALPSRWVVGAKLTYRKLKSVMDDMCNDEGAGKWASANGYSAADSKTIADTVGHCFLYNPGGDLTANIDFDNGKGFTPVVIPGSALNFPKPERTFKALELTFERPWDGKWTLQGSYVLAYSKGNTEGYVKSDIGQDDAGISQDWDYPGLMEGSNGYLPNDRRHTFKVFGSYQVAEEWRVGGNMLLQSGRPKNCLGYYNGDLDSVSVGYGAASFYCNGVLNPRGTLGRLGWTKEISAQVQYQPKWKKGLTFQVDVLNMFNERNVTAINEQGESALGTVSPTYLQPVSIQTGRSFRFTAGYEF